MLSAKEPPRFSTGNIRPLPWSRSVMDHYFCHSHLGMWAAIGFLIGTIGSALAGYIGMMVTVRSNVRTAEAAKNGLQKALTLAFKGGSVTGLMVVGLGLHRRHRFLLHSEKIPLLNRRFMLLSGLGSDARS